jgi:hypothetical protein
MGRLTAALLLAACVTIQVWAQTPPSQTPQDQPAAPEQKVPDHNPAPDGASAVASPGQTPAAPAAGTETDQSPLDQFQNFSAIAYGGPLPGYETERHFYRAGNLIRVEGEAPKGNYFVTDLKTRQTHAVDTHNCLIMFSPYIRTFPFFETGPNIKYERIQIGEDTVDGHPTHVEDLIVHTPKSPVPLHFRLYEAKDLQGFPIKMEGRREKFYHWTILYKDVRIGPQDPSLFMYPDKCESQADFTKTTTGAKPKSASPKPK